MKVARILRFGPPNVITNDDLPRPEPAAGQILVRVKAAGVGNWYSLIREGEIKLQPLPLILGSELSGIVEAIGAQVSVFKLGDEVYGATNEQLGSQTRLHVVASAGFAALDYVQSLGAEKAVDYKKERFEESMTGFDVVIDTVGGDAQQRSLRLLKPGGILVSVVSPVPEITQKRYGIRAAYFYVDVTTAWLNKITELFDSGKLVSNVGTVLPLEEARIATKCLEVPRTSAARLC